jgi:fatty-acyl-CoA synthase
MSEALKEEIFRTAGSTGSTASTAKAWLRALELTAPIANHPERTLPSVILEVAAEMEDAPALLSEQECFTYRALAARTNQYARWALDQGMRKGDVVCLLMANRPEFMAIWLGISSAGAVVSLLNTNLAGPSLAHCIRAVSPKHIIVSADFTQRLSDALVPHSSSPLIWMHGDAYAPFPRIDLEVAGQSGEPLSRYERPPVRIDDLALYIYTSGTTGLPKAARVSHARVMQWSHWFAGMLSAQSTDRMYNCLPMYHSVGGVQAPGAVLVAGGSVVLRDKFSASRFWSDIVRWDCTLFQYIGELCRYLLHAEPCREETMHRIRIACGNGLAPEIWESFKERFRIPRIVEFYAATEGGVSLFNVQGKPGAIGHIPAYLAHRFSPALVVFDSETGEPARNQQGFCVPCAPYQPGEALGKVMNDPANAGSRFEGYTTEEATEQRILRDVFAPGDAWVRTGDLMRKDEQGYFYFVDRIGDTFRRKGENVATTEVSQALCAFRGVSHANVYGVAVPNTEGRVGMAALVAEDNLDLAGLRKHLERCLPAYARPVFLRIRSAIDVTGTFKYSKTELISQGYNPLASGDALYFDSLEAEAFVPFDNDLYDRIQSGGIRF